MDRIDMELSRWLFELSLPTEVEAIFSVPACFFGLIPTVYVGPIGLAILALSNDYNYNDKVGGNDNYALTMLWIIAVILSVSFLTAWTLFLRGTRWPLAQFLGKKILYLVGFPWSIGILYLLLKSSSSRHSQYQELHYNNVFSLAIYSLYLWCWTVLIVLALKRWSKRYRPCVKYSRQWIIANKSFPVIPIMLSKTQADESFPSGDAASAAALAIPMLYIDSTNATTEFPWSVSTLTFLAGTMVFLASTGRVYFLAHHVADVLVGALTAGFVHLISTYMGFGVFNMQWWYPFAANALVATYAKLSEKKSK
ncbi:PAP2 superfamily protein [Nitzschia inconspicua]|uniref:PAP2 superfamily protein n=1 Tax=Nitzschia inconspicua TaxID=303405 RepID=A0A9K3KWH2_9STRA|nr:PAP2 superfamily protein [Nitzschia inconspicua]